MKFYALENHIGFGNTWSVLAFSSRNARDEHVRTLEGTLHRGSPVVCRAVHKSRITFFAANWSLTQNREIKPRPFSGERWIIMDDGNPGDIPGYLGHVIVGRKEDGESLF